MPSSNRPTSKAIRPILQGSITAALLSLIPGAMAVDGTWTQTNNIAAPGALWSDVGNWAAGTIADGVDANAYFVYNPGQTGGDVGGNIVLDSSRSIGHLYMSDLDGLASSSVALLSSPTFSPTLTLQTLTGKPTIEANLLVNNNLGGNKKAIIQNNGTAGTTFTLAGTQGFDKTGFGFLSLRSNMALTGDIGVLGGTLDTRIAINNNVAVSGAGILNLDFGLFSGPTNMLAPATTLTLGGALGSGYVTEAARAAVVSQTVAGLTLNAGAHSIQANANSATNTFTWNFGTITRNAGSALNLFGANTFTFNFTAGGSVPGNDTSGIAGGWITFGNNDFARVNGTSLATYTAYTNNTWGAGLNTTINGVNFPNVPGTNSQSNATTHTLRFQDGSARILNLSGTNTIETGGILFGNNGNSMHQLIGGAITSGTNEMILHGYSSAGGWGVIVNSDIVDNGATPLQLVKAGTGPVVLDGDKSFTGGTILGQGTLVLGKALGGSSTGSVLGPIVNSGVLAFNRTGTYTPTNTITGNGVIANWSDGTVVLNKEVSAGGLDLRSGGITLDFSGPSAPDNNIVPAGSLTTNGFYSGGGRLSLRDGSLNITGAAGESNTQAFAMTDIQGSTSINLTPGAGGSVTLSLGAYNRPNNANDGAGTLKLSLPANATLTTPVSFPSLANALVADNGQAFVTVNGTDWGAKNGTNTGIVAGSTVGGFYTPLTSLTGNADYNADTTVIGNTTLASLRFDTVASPATLTVNSGIQLNLGGVLVTPNSAAPVTIAGPGAIGAANTGGRDLFVFQNDDQPMTISAVIANNSSGQTTNLVKEGSGELILSGANTMTGKVFVQGGLLRMTGGNIGTGATAAGNVFIREGEMRLEGSSSVNTGGNFISIGQRLGEKGTLSLTGSSSWTTNGDFNVSDVNSEGILNVQDTAALTVSSLYVGKGGSSVGTLNLSGGAVNVNTGGADIRVGGNTQSDSISQGIINQTGGALNANKNFQLGAHGIGTYNQSAGTFTALSGFTGIGRFISGQGTWNLSGTGTINTQAAATGAALIVGEQGIGTLNISGNSNVLAKTLSLGHNNGVGIINQNGGTVALNSTGTLTGFTNAQAGVVLGGAAIGNIPFSSGTYNLNGGTLSTFGITRGAGTGSLSLNGGTLQPIASNTSFLQGLTSATVGAGGALINTQGFNVNVGQSLSHDTALGATVDGGLTKSGAGVLSLHGNNSYTGATTIAAGGIRLAAADAAAVWDADTLGAVSGTAVATWTDTVGAKNATQGTALNQPQVITNQFNGHNAVRFNGASSQSLVVAAADSIASADSSFTIAAVVKTGVAGVGTATNWWSNTGIIDMEVAGASNDWGIAINGTGNIGAGLGNFNAPGDQTLYSTGAVNDSNAHLLLYSINNGVVTLSVDGVTQTLSTGNIAARQVNAFRFGALQTAANFFTGDIGEVRMYRSGMSDAALGAIGAQLATKFGLATTFSNVSNFLPDTSNVNLSASGVSLDLNGFRETIGSLSGVAGSTVTLGTNGGLTTGADGSSTSYAGSISGAGSLTKTGAGTFTLAAGSSATHSGATVVDAGVLVVTGAINGTSSVTVNSGGTLAGNGTITTSGNGNVTIASGGKLSPGTSPGTLTLSLGTGSLNVGPAVSLTGTAALVFELGTSSDKVVLAAGSLDLGAGVTEFDDFSFAAGSGFGVGTYTLFETSNPILGNLSGNMIGMVGGFVSTLELADGGTDLVLTVVPEPGALASLIGGLGLLAGFQRRRKN